MNAISEEQIMRGVSTTKNELLKIAKELPPGEVREVIDYAKFLRWKRRQEEFAKRFNTLRQRTRKSTEKAGYRLKDVNKLITQVRAKNA